MELIVAILASHIVAQAGKLAILLGKVRKVEWQAIFFAGGMPSVHAATVTSVAFGVFLDQGASALFAVALVFALIVIYDAMTLRRDVKEHAGMLRKLYAMLDERGAKTLQPYRGQIGHTPAEVFVGVMVGILVTWGVFYVF